MKLYINKDIAPDREKVSYWMSGQDAVSYSDISVFLDYMREYAPDDSRIDVELHSCGGDCVEGYAIYDALRTSGKEISCTVVGQCASMATIILLSAPFERRTMYPHASMLIHEPYYPDGLQGKITINKLESIKADLQNEKAKMMQIYLERTGADEELINEQIKKGDWFGVDKAIELGFISSAVPVASAKEDTQQYTTNNEKEEMKINEESAIGKALATIARAVGAMEEEKPVALTLTDVNGTEIEIEREEGEVQVGDATSATDGEYTLEDGRTLVVVDGVITEIKNTEEQNDDTDEEVEALKKQIAELEEQLAEANKNVKSESESEVLAYVAQVGGLNALKTKTGSYSPAGRAETKEEKSYNEIIREKQASFKPYFKR